MKTIIITALFFVSTLSLAKRGVWKEKREALFKELNLSVEQKKQLKDIRKNKFSNMRELRQNKRALRQELNEAFQANTSEAELRSKHKLLMQAKEELSQRRFEKVLSIRNILSQEQRKQFFEMRKKMRRGRFKQ